MPSRRPNRLRSHRLFFPAACLYAAIALPLSMAAMLAGWDRTPGLAGSHHGHEMIFGFALAVIAGYTRPPARALAGPAVRGLAVCSSRLRTGPRLLAEPVTQPRLRSAAGLAGGAPVQRRQEMAQPHAGAAYADALWSSRTLALPPFHPMPEPTTLLHTGVILLLLLMTFASGRLIAPAVGVHWKSAASRRRRGFSPGSRPH